MPIGEKPLRHLEKYHSANWRNTTAPLREISLRHLEKYYCTTWRNTTTPIGEILLTRRWSVEEREYDC
jgi:hypothetical protein